MLMQNNLAKATKNNDCVESFRSINSLTAFFNQRGEKLRNLLKFIILVTLAFLFTNTNIFAQDKTSDNGAMLAASKCDVATAKTYFGNDLKNKTIEEYKGDMLSVAVEVDCADIFEFLLLNGVEVNFKDKNSGDTALHTAALFGRVELSKRLLVSGADINARNNSDWTPLKTAIIHQNNDVIKVLLDNGADLTVKDNDGNTLLIDAAMIDDINLVKTLLLAGVKVDEQNNSGWAALTYVVCGSNMKTLKELILLGANINLKDNEGKTPLMWAAVSGSPESVEQLIASGANINAKDREGKSALMYAAEAKEHGSEIIQLLCKAAESKKCF